jgi:hypothetical protein
MIDIRTLAALDIAFLGPRIILIEFGAGVLLPIALGALTLARARSLNGALLGLYLITLGINYVPLLLYAISIVRAGSAAAEIAEGSNDRTARTAMFRRYRRQSLLLLVPLMVPIASAIQEWRRRRG